MALSDCRTLLFAVLVGTLLGDPAAAFKPRTHVWVAQQVLNDVEDGCSKLPDASCVTIVTCVNERDGVFQPWTLNAPCQSREYRVADDVADALRRFPAEYRAGHIGPDVFPDFVVGQMTAHPGIAGGWKADEWLRWLLRKRGAGGAERAFVYGYLGHAAGDFFAHTYVNAYAGDVFRLFDGEQTVERRHFALEDFIDRHTPPITGPDGREVAAADLLRVPGSFVAEHLILNDEVDGQYRKPAASAPHLLAMYGVVRAIEESIKKTDFAKIESELLDRIDAKEKEIEDAVRNADSLASPIRRAQDQIELAKRVLAEHDRKIAEQKKAVEAAADALTDLIEQRQKADELVASAPGRRNELNDQLRSLEKRLRDTPAKHVRTVKDKVCKKLRDPLGLLKKACKWSEKPVEEINEAYKRLQRDARDTGEKLSKLEADVLRAKQTLLDAPRVEAEKRAVQEAAELELRRLELERLKDRTGQEALDIASKTLAELEARRQELRDRIADLQSVTNRMLGPLGAVRDIRKFLQAWHADVLQATAAYIEAGRDAGLALVVGSNVLDPYSEWMTCWSPAFMGIPSQVTRSVCAVERSGEELGELVSRARKEARDLFGETGGWIVDPLGKLEEEVRKVLDPAVREAAVRLTGALAGPEWQAFAAILAEEYDEERLNELFGRDGSGKNLLLIPDIASRARKDMAVGDDLFSPARFAAAYDAVVLSKLALLDAAELNRLARDCGWRRTLLGKRHLYDERAQSNVLIKAVQSIDGDHAWSPVAPPKPRRVGKDRTPPKERSFGRRRPDGFRLWASCRARKVVFPGIFRGPLNPELRKLLPKDYRYRPSPEEPFPWIIHDCRR